VSRLTDLIAQTKAKNPQLGADLDREFKILSSRLPFGLNFERHSPEAVELPQRVIRKGDKVRVLTKRGSTKKGDPRLWQVKSIHKVGESKLAEIELLSTTDSQTQTVTLADLVVVAEFRDTIYPGLISTGKVERGNGKPFHTVINGENYHVLKALTYTHRGKVDAIYIDPPYNSGARDWKYNNDYVEADDLYRHSKWLAMMERRLVLAKELLNPSDSVLIVAIDEKEYLRLGLLLEQTFENAKIQMISSVISPSGAARNLEFTRVNEFVYFVMIGQSTPIKTPDDMLFTDTRSVKENRSPIWNQLRRLGAGPARTDSPSKFYPVLVNPESGAVVGSGTALSFGQTREDYRPPEGLVATWPTMTNGADGRWELKRASFEERLAEGHIRTSGLGKNGDWSIQYLRNAQIERLASGELLVTGRSSQGWLEIDYSADRQRALYAKTVWNKGSHDSRTYGSWILRALLPERKFPFPKSLYAVEDALRFFVATKKNAIVLDFFSGSGTTAHAVMRLNHQDAGQRQCISVTNNEVSPDEQESLRKKLLRQGDPDWELHGICDYVTKPRVAAAITGHTPEGKPIKGNYKFTDEFPMADGFEENAEFFTLTYETPVSISQNRAFARIAPLLWMRAGSSGSRIDKLPDAGWAVADTYGLLVDVDTSTPFCKAVKAASDLKLAYIVTDDDRRFQAIAHRLPNGVEPIRLYESYLTNFSFTNGE
jgi:adenine-specific DNA-methyltransferase